MAIFNLFSKRQKLARGDVPDVYTYDVVPNELRVQIVHIFQEAFQLREYDGQGNIKKTGDDIVQALCKEYGLFLLPPSTSLKQNRWIELFDFILNTDDVEHCIDAIEIGCLFIEERAPHYGYRLSYDSERICADAIGEINDRFKQNGVGFQYVDGEIIRIDSELLHTEAVKPALKLLNHRHFQGAQEEYLAAHEHYRHGRNKEALVDCLKSFESTMKAICDKRGWAYDKGATAKGLIQVCFENKLIPEFWQNEFSHLKGLLESGIPTGRNKLGGHGQGSALVAVPSHLVAYMLHMTASTIVFLGEAERALA